jgi:hypothetical protein
VAEVQDVHIHIHVDDEFSEKLDEVLRLLRTIAKVEVFTVANLDEIRDAVAGNTDAVNSAVQLMVSLADALEAAASDPAQVTELAQQLRANTQVLADAVVANTPAAPGPGAATEGPGPEPTAG